MKKKLLIPAICVTFLVSGCSYNPFNFINVYSENYEVLQCNEYIVWDKNPDASKADILIKGDSGYEVYKTTSTTYKESILSDWSGKKLCIGYHNGEKDSKGNTKYLEKTKAITIESAFSFSYTNELYVTSESYVYRVNGQNNTKNPYTISENSTITVTNHISLLTIENMVGNFRFEIESRTNNLFIHMKNCDIKGVDNSVSSRSKEAATNYEDRTYWSTFKYAGSNTDVNFYFTISGENKVSSYSKYKYAYGTDTISVPNMVLYEKYDSGSLTVTGSQAYFNRHKEKGDDTEVSAGFAVNATKIINLCDKTDLKLIGGKGGQSVLNDGGDGGRGQFPFGAGTKIVSAQTNSIGIKAGDGADGKNISTKSGTAGKGGDVFSFEYLTKAAYFPYKHCLYNLGDPTPGKGGKNASGTYSPDGTVLTEPTDDK